jgi:hypothetical protein
MTWRCVDGGEIENVERTFAAEVGRDRLPDIEIKIIDAFAREARRTYINRKQAIVTAGLGKTLQEMAADKARPPEYDCLPVCHQLIALVHGPIQSDAPAA